MANYRMVEIIQRTPYGASAEPTGRKWSSIHRWMAEGCYQSDWGRIEGENDRAYGE